MSLIQERYPIFRSRPRYPEVSSLHRELLSARNELLLQTSRWASLPVARKKAQEVLHLACLSQRCFLDEVTAEQASVTLRHIERTLRHMLEASYGVCRECRKDIPLSRLRRAPLALLCTECIEARLETLAANAL
jgi:RNA polymerase-binding transcription factor DksA